MCVCVFTKFPKHEGHVTFCILKVKLSLTRSIHWAIDKDLLTQVIYYVLLCLGYVTHNYNLRLSFGRTWLSGVGLRSEYKTLCLIPLCSVLRSFLRLGCNYVLLQCWVHTLMFEKDPETSLLLVAPNNNIPKAKQGCLMSPAGYPWHQFGFESWMTRGGIYLFFIR